MSFLQLVGPPAQATITWDLVWNHSCQSPRYNSIFCPWMCPLFSPSLASSLTLTHTILALSVSVRTSPRTSTGDTRLSSCLHSSVLLTTSAPSSTACASETGWALQVSSAHNLIKQGRAEHSAGVQANQQVFDSELGPDTGSLLQRWSFGFLCYELRSWTVVVCPVSCPLDSPENWVSTVRVAIWLNMDFHLLFLFCFVIISIPSVFNV